VWTGGDIKIKKLIITSATLDERILEEYFKGLNPGKISIAAPTYGV
jgi:HrpA-like RNA helicase